MSTATVTDVDSLEALDFEETPLCQFKRDECDQEATHRSLWDCGCPQLFCTEHARYVVGRPYTFWFCSLCQGTKSRLLLMEPI